MPFVFLALGVVLLVVAVNGTHKDMFALLKSEFTGENNFLVWVAAIAILGAIGYVKPLRAPANALLLLVLLVIVLKNGGGFFDQFNTQIRNPVAPSKKSTGSLTTSDLAEFQGPFLPSGQSVPNIGFTPNTPGLIPGMIPGA